MKDLSSGPGVSRVQGFRIPVFDWGAEFFLDPLLDSVFQKKALEPRSFYTLVGVSARDILNPSMDSSLFSSSCKSWLVPYVTS